MSKDNSQSSTSQEQNETFSSALETVLREGAQKMLQEAIEAEVDDFINFYKDRRDPNGKRLAVRNGFMPARRLCYAAYQNRTVFFTLIDTVAIT